MAAFIHKGGSAWFGDANVSTWIDDVLIDVAPSPLPPAAARYTDNPFTPGTPEWSAIERLHVNDGREASARASRERMAALRAGHGATEEPMADRLAAWIADDEADPDSCPLDPPKPSPVLEQWQREFLGRMLAQSIFERRKATPLWQITTS